VEYVDYVLRPAHHVLGYTTQLHKKPSQ
jgi:hypothetical protein